VAFVGAGRDGLVGQRNVSAAKDCFLSLGGNESGSLGTGLKGKGGIGGG